MCASLAIAALAGALGGCGGTASAGGQSQVPRYELRVRTIGGLGRIITDGQGFTLYMYAPDHQGPSRCFGLCARSWPPLLLPPGVAKPSAGPGIKTALLGTVPRPGGSVQVTYNGWPLYLWQGDSAPGQATGQADDMGLWYTMSVTGAVDKGTPES